MSFFSKIVENKPIAIAAGIALALGAAFTYLVLHIEFIVLTRVNKKVQIPSLK